MQNTNKKPLRKSLLERRLKLSKDYVTSASERILNTLSNNVSLVNIKKIHIYKPIKKYNEIDTEKFIGLVHQAYPNIRIEIAPNKLSAKTEVPKSNKYDLVIVPVLGFDRRGFRLGYGGGYYDRLLAQNDCRQVFGLAYSFSELDKLPDEPHDQKMDAIITEKEIISALH